MFRAVTHPHNHEEEGEVGQEDAHGRSLVDPVVGVFVHPGTVPQQRFRALYLAEKTYAMLEDLMFNKGRGVSHFVVIIPPHFPLPATRRKRQKKIQNNVKLIEKPRGLFLRK